MVSRRKIPMDSWGLLLYGSNNNIKNNNIGWQSSPIWWGFGSESKHSCSLIVRWEKAARNARWPPKTFALFANLVLIIAFHWFFGALIQCQQQLNNSNNKETMSRVDNFRRVNLKRKVFSRGKKQNFKRYKKTPKCVKDNPENQIAREKDVYCFSDSGEEEDDLGMGLDISDLSILDENLESKQKELMALTQDSVRPLFTDETYDESKLLEGLAELKHSTFRPNQKEIIRRILYGRSTLFISPTGSGKSLCYQLPALLYWRFRKYITIVVSPLISLMEDQMSNFPAALKAVTLHSGHNMMQRRRAIEQLVNNQAQVAFISPEAIVSGLLSVENLKNLPPVGFVCIDEAHCLSEWSHNFRPAYMQFFKILYEQMNIKTFLGITATATKVTSFAIARSLIINPDTDVIGSTTIPENLILSVSYEKNKEKALIDLLKSNTFRILPSIIVYCNRREETEHVASRVRTAMQNYKSLIEVPQRMKKTPSKDDSIRSNDSNSSSSSEKAHMELSWNSEAYHAGLSSETRKRIQRQFIKGEIRVVVATIAFGMGINKSNVRAIIHYDLPSSFESYVQEIGRAGRDGKPAQCHLFLQANKSDLYYQQRNIYASITEAKNLKKLTDYLFRPKCNCTKLFRKQDELDKLDKLNQMDPHEIRSLHRTQFTNIEISISNDDEDLDDDLVNNENGAGEKENQAVRYIRQSIIKKHRFCSGHEISFSLEEAVNDTNLKPESIITLICQLQKVYPQLQIEQFPPTKSICNLLCYHGPSQMEELSKTSKPVNTALHLHRLQQLKTTGSRGETPGRMAFDYIKVASMLSKPSADVARMIKKTEWELVDKTGRFRRSQIRVSFDGNSFHLRTIGDLSDEELDEINAFLVHFNQLYENIERRKLVKVFNTMKSHCTDVKQLQVKERLEVSAKLKAALKAYFDTTSEHQITDTVDDVRQIESDGAKQGDDSDEMIKMQKIKYENVRKSARAFLAAHGTEHTKLNIARIFQGVSTPIYPAEIWGMNKKWWRCHVDVDFAALTSIIEEEIFRFS